jgi:hypothetical protein
MHADVGNASTETRLRGVGSPCRLLLASPLERLAQPPLRVFDDELADGAEIAALADRPRLTHERVSRVGVRQRVELSRALHDVTQRVRFLERSRGGLVGYDVKAMVERSYGHGEMQVIGGDNRDEVDPVWTGRLGRQHLLIAAVGALVRDTVRTAGNLRLRRVGAESAGDQLDLAIEFRSQSMHRSDERPWPTTDHSHPNHSHLHGRGTSVHPIHRR